MDGSPAARNNSAECLSGFHQHSLLDSEKRRAATQVEGAPHIYSKYMVLVEEAVARS